VGPAAAHRRGWRAPPAWANKRQDIPPGCARVFVHSSQGSSGALVDEFKKQCSVGAVGFVAHRGRPPPRAKARNRVGPSPTTPGRAAQNGGSNLVPPAGAPRRSGRKVGGGPPPTLGCGGSLRPPRLEGRIRRSPSIIRAPASFRRAVEIIAPTSAQRRHFFWGAVT